ncbi:MAG: hypothetical protein ABJI69_01215 [Balneola sp.]
MFQTEKELVLTLKSVLEDFNSSAYVEIFDEVSLGYGIADLVVSNFSYSKCRWGANKSLLNSNDINIYSIVEKEEGIDFIKIIELTRQSNSTIRKSITKLVEYEYILKKNDCYFINNPYQVSFESLYAIEAKLRNWKRALKQAYRYKWFADYSYVVLDYYHINKALEELDAFKKYNVGLASVSIDGSLIRHYKPKREKPYDSKMRALFSEKTKLATS